MGSVPLREQTPSIIGLDDCNELRGTYYYVILSSYYVVRSKSKPSNQYLYLTSARQIAKGPLKVCLTRWHSHEIHTFLIIRLLLLQSFTTVTRRRSAVDVDETTVQLTVTMLAALLEAK